MLQVGLCRLHVASLTVDEGAEDVGLHHGLVLLQTTEDLLQGPIGVIREPPGFGEQELGVGKAAVLLGDVLQQFDGFEQVLWGRGACLPRLDSAVYQILFS